MAAGVKHLSRTFVWILMGMLMLGLAGFGAVNFSGSLSSVAVVGETEVSVNEYMRELQQEQQAIQAQTGQQMPIAQLTTLGVDRVVLSRLIAIAALDNEVEKLGLSIGDENLAKEITGIPGFQGPNGQFDRETYKFTLERVGLTEREFEDDVRRESARTLVQGAIMAGAKMPATLRDTLTGYIGARRSFTWVQLSNDDLAMITLAPTDAELQAFYDANPDLFTLPETKKITYVLMRPDMLLDQVEVDQAALEKLFQDRAAEFQAPERRLVERLVFSSEDTAASAKAQLELGATTFEALVTDRGLTLADIDMGDVTMGDLEGAAEAVFSAQVGEVVGPLPTNLGPALFRVNGRLEARVTALDDVADDLRLELASDQARRLVEARAEGIDDLLAGGATLEEVAEETAAELGQIDWTALTDEGIAAYSGFRDAAQAVTTEDFPSVVFLEDGSLMALRLNEVLPPRPEPLEAAYSKAQQGWNAEQAQKALATEAKAILNRAQANGGFDAAQDSTLETGLTRTAYIDNTPADMLNQVFEMEVGEYRLVSDAASTVILRLDEILPPAESEEMTALTEALGAQLDQALSQALFQVFLRDTQVRGEPRVDQQALNAVHANFQ